MLKIDQINDQVNNIYAPKLGDNSYKKLIERRVCWGAFDWK